MTQTDPQIQRLLEANPLREPALRSIIYSLRLPEGSRGLDIGCGIGLQTALLAQAVGPAGRITGMDINPELLAFATRFAASEGLAERVSFREGDMNRLPFPDQSFDWVWSADCAGYPTGELAPILKEMMRVLKPGGRVIILAWTGQQLLPGYPILEARLNANYSNYLPYLQGKEPDQHFLRAPRWFIEAGLEDIRAETFVGEVQGPLNAAQRKALSSLFDMLWAEPQNSAEDADWQERLHLCQPDSPDCILDQPGYYAFFTYTVIQGRLPI